MNRTKVMRYIAVITAGTNVIIAIGVLGFFALGVIATSLKSGFPSLGLAWGIPVLFLYIAYREACFFRRARRGESRRWDEYVLRLWVPCIAVGLTLALYSAFPMFLMIPTALFYTASVFYFMSA